jgi:hypothetical protein
VQIPSGAKIIDATGKTLIPGLVGMHEHLFYPSAAEGPLTAVEQFFSFPPLYLASGVTSARTTGSMDPYGDLAVKARVDSGKMLGPDFYLTTPYLEGAPALIPQMHELKDADEARAFVRYWHSVGFTSVKAYVDVTPAELRAGIDEAHKLNMKVTGHLCSVGYNEAAEMGIDNLEHGPFGAPDGELYSKRQPGVCGPDYLAEVREIVTNVEPDSPQLKQTIQNLVAHHVAITSTLAVLEGGLRPPMDRADCSRRETALSTHGSIMCLSGCRTIKAVIKRSSNRASRSFEIIFSSLLKRSSITGIQGSYCPKSENESCIDSVIPHKESSMPFWSPSEENSSKAFSKVFFTLFGSYGRKDVPFQYISQGCFSMMSSGTRLSQSWRVR